MNGSIIRRPWPARADYTVGRRTCPKYSSYGERGSDCQAAGPGKSRAEQWKGFESMATKASGAGPTTAGGAWAGCDHDPIQMEHRGCLYVAYIILSMPRISNRQEHRCVWWRLAACRHPGSRARRESGMRCVWRVIERKPTLF